MTGLVVLAPGGTLTVPAPATRTATVVQAAAAVTVAPAPARLVQITQPGPQGPVGPGLDAAAVTAAVITATATALAAHPGQVFTQDQPASTWRWDHQFGRLPAVTLYTLDGRRFYADVDSTTTTVTVTFPMPRTGRAVLT